MKKSITSLLTISFLYFCLINSISSASENPAWEFTLGAKTSYSAGVSDSFIYYKPYLQAEFSTDFLSILAEAARAFNYQITDGNGLYEYIDFNEAAISLGLFPAEWLSVDIEYRHSSGDSEYANNSLLFECELIFNRISLIGGYTGEYSEYDFNSAEIEQNNHTYTGEINYLHSDFISFDLGYTLNNICFVNPDFNYKKHIIRAGAVPHITESAFIVAGLSAGLDSEEYVIYGFDFGLNSFFLEHIRIMAVYSFQYYDAQGAEISTYEKETGSEHGKNSKSKNPNKNNPFLSIERRGESYTSHSVVAGVSYTF